MFRGIFQHEISSLQTICCNRVQDNEIAFRRGEKTPRKQGLAGVKQPPVFRKRTGLTAAFRMKQNILQSLYVQLVFEP